MTAPVWLVELQAWDGAEEVVLRYADREFATRPGETPASTIYPLRLVQPVLVQRDAFDTRKTSGRSRIGYGDVILNNADGGLDALLAYAVDGRALLCRRGPVGGVYPDDFPVRFAGTMQQQVPDQKTITIKIRDQQQLLAIPFQPTTFAGSNSLPNGLEGTADDLKGKPKPVCLGVVLNYAAPCVNTSKLIYQVHDAAASVSAVYDRARGLTAGASYATVADLQDDALEPDPGTYRVYSGSAGTYFRLGSSPTGEVTADVTEGASAADRYPGQVFARAMQRLGLTTGDWNAADVSALDTAAPYEIGQVWDAETTGLEVLDAIASSAGAWWAPDTVGVIRVQQLAAPSGAPVVSLTRDTIIGDLIQLPSNDPGAGIPAYQSILQYGRNQTVQVVDFTEPATYSATAPSNPTTDTLWVDTSVTPNLWKRWSGTAWVKITPESGDIDVLQTQNAPAEAGAETTTGKSIDVLIDGATYARVKTTELASGQVAQTRDTVDASTLTVNQQRREAIMYAQVI